MTQPAVKPLSGNSEELLATLLRLVDHTEALLAYWDKNQTCVFANDAYLAFLGKTREQVIGAKMDDLLGAYYTQSLAGLQTSYKGYTQIFGREVPIPGGVRSLVVTYTPDLQSGKVSGVFEQAIDVTPSRTLERELEAAKTKLAEFSLHDPLTGLPKRVLLLDRASLAIALAKRTNGMVAVLCLESEDFKKNGEAHGREEADKLLKQIASRLKSSIRESDTVTRLDDDRLLVLAWKVTSAAGAEAMATRISSGLRQQLPFAGTTISLSFNIGIALYPSHGATPEALIASSERALQAAKGLGKNRYAIATVS